MVRTGELETVKKYSHCTLTFTFAPGIITVSQFFALQIVLLTAGSLQDER